ncbi:hypothetical protein GQX74_013801, partial [Glossina fuscipes]
MTELQLSVWLLFASFTPVSGLANLAKAFWSVRPIKFPGPGFSLPFANAIVTLSSLEALAGKLAKPIAAVAVLDKSTNGPVFAEPLVVVTVKLPLFELLIAESKIEWDGSPNIEELLPNFGGFWPKREPLGKPLILLSKIDLGCASSAVVSSSAEELLPNIRGFWPKLMSFLSATLEVAYSPVVVVLLHGKHVTGNNGLKVELFALSSFDASVFCCGRPFKKPSLSEDSTAAGLGNMVVLGMPDKLEDVVEDVVKVNTPLVGEEPALKAKSTFGVMISLFEVLATGKLKLNFWAKSERKRPL